MKLDFDMQCTPCTRHQIRGATRARFRERSQVIGRERWVTRGDGEASRKPSRDSRISFHVEDSEFGGINIGACTMSSFFRVFEPHAPNVTVASRRKVIAAALCLHSAVLRL
jgi:hypothetical protein